MEPAQKRRKHKNTLEDSGTANGSTTNSSQTSLQRLLALDKSFPTLEGQLEEAGVILKLPSDWSDGPWLPDLSRSLVFQYSKPRAEWLLKWILDKFKAQDANGATARSTIRAWVFLGWLTRIVPNPSMALKTAQFLRIVEQTLTPAEDAGTPFFWLRANHNLTSTHEGSTLDGGIESRKRKLREVEDGSNSEIHEQIHLFKAVSQVLIILCDRSSKRETQSDSSKHHAEQIRSVLRSDSLQSSRLLRLCLHRAHILAETNGQIDLVSFSYFEPFLRIWELRAIDPTDESHVSAEGFSEYCLVPACMIIQAPESQFKAAALPEVEKLIARHMFLPARGQFFAAIDLPRKSQSKETIGLEKLIEPVAAYIRPLLTDGDANHARKSLLFGLHSILDIGLRCSPLGSVRQRIKEEPWNQAIFVALWACAGINGTSIPSQTISIVRMELRAMLKVLSTHKVNLPQDLLHHLVVEYSGLANDDSDVEWSLVSEAIGIDPEMFTLKNHEDREQVNGRPTMSLGHLVLRKMTDFGLVQQEVDSSTHSSQISVILQLMQAHSKARDLNGIITEWFSNLRQFGLDGVGPPTRTIWADQKVVNGLEAFLESSMTKGQIMKCLDHYASYVTQVATILTKNPSDETSWNLDDDAQSNFAASIVILEALTRAIHMESTIDAAQETLSSLYHSLIELAAVAARNDLRICSRLFRVLNRLWNLLFPLQNESTLRVLGGVVTFQSRCFQVFASKFGPSSQDSDQATHQTALDGGTFFTSVAACISRFPEYKDTLITFLTQFLIVDSDAPIPHSVPDVAMIGKSQQDTGFMDVVSHLTFYLVLLRILPPTARRAVFAKTISQVLSQMCRIVTESNSTLDAMPTTPFWKVLIALQDQIFSAESISMRVEYVDTLLTFHEAIASKDQDEAQISSEIFENIYLSLRAQQVPRDIRGRILDRISNDWLSDRDLSGSDEAQKLRRLAVMRCFLEHSNSGTLICKDPLFLCTVAKSCQWSQVQTLDVFEDVAHTCFSQAVNLMGADQLDAFIRNMTTLLKELEMKDSNALMTPGPLRLLKVLTTMFGVDGIPQLDAISTLRDFLSVQHESAFNLSRHWVSSIENQNVISERELLCMVSALDLMMASPQSLETGDILRQIVERLARNGTSQATSLRILQIASKQKSTDIESFTTDHQQRLLKVSAAEIAFEDYHIMRKALKQKISLLGEQMLSSYWSTLLKHIEVEVSEQELDLLYVTIEKMQRLASDEITATETEGGVTPFAILPTLCEQLPGASSPGVFHQLMGCIHMIIREKPWLMSQHGVDGILGAFTQTCTRSSPQLDPACAPTIYSRLCEASHDLVMLNRKQLRGRFHMLLPLLQVLLACLFTPESLQSKAAASQPKWLDPRRELLTTKHALLYSRLLETICSPSVSSAMSGKHRGKRASASLTDETKAVRKYAGQYVQGVILQFCSGQLSGRMSPEIRSAILPGMYACIDVVEMDALRAMNAGMDSGMRAVWKGLYGEWKRATERV